MSLIYLITSLPPLKLGEKPGLSWPDFAENARSMLKGFDRKELELALLVAEVHRSTQERHAVTLNLPGRVADLEARLQERRIQAEQSGYPLPEWVLKDRPHHLLMRYWYQSVRRYARSRFLQEYSRIHLNMNEMIAALLCKHEGLERTEFMAQMEGGFDSSWKVMVERYDEQDMGIAKRFIHYRDIKDILQLEDFQEMETRLNRLRWQIIDSCLGTETFSIDQVLAYFFQLRIVEREASWNRKKGEEILDSILECHLEEAT